jgi:hypothetical protein
MCTRGKRFIVVIEWLFFRTYAQSIDWIMYTVLQRTLLKDSNFNLGNRLTLQNCGLLKDYENTS